MAFGWEHSYTLAPAADAGGAMGASMLQIEPPNGCRADDTDVRNTGSLGSKEECGKTPIDTGGRPIP